MARAPPSLPNVYIVHIVCLAVVRLLGLLRGLRLHILEEFFFSLSFFILVVLGSASSFAFASPSGFAFAFASPLEVLHILLQLLLQLAWALSVLVAHAATIVAHKGPGHLAFCFLFGIMHKQPMPISVNPTHLSVRFLHDSKSKLFP